MQTIEYRCHWSVFSEKAKSTFMFCHVFQWNCPSLLPCLAYEGRTLQQLCSFGLDCAAAPAVRSRLVEALTLRHPAACACLRFFFLRRQNQLLRREPGINIGTFPPCHPVILLLWWTLWQEMQVVKVTRQYILPICWMLPLEAGNWNPVTATFWIIFHDNNTWHFPYLH